MHNSIPSPTAEQSFLDRLMARLMRRRPQTRKSGELRAVANAMTAAKRSRRADNAKRLARGNVDEQ